MTIDVCPACGYPTIGPDLCAFCRPVGALIGDQTFEPMLFRDEAASRIGVSGNAAPWLQSGRGAPARGAPTI